MNIGRSSVVAALYVSKRTLQSAHAARNGESFISKVQGGTNASHDCCGCLAQLVEAGGLQCDNCVIKC